MGMTFLYLLSSTLAAISWSCSFQQQLLQNAPHIPPLSPPAGTQRHTDECRHHPGLQKSSRTLLARGLLRAISSGTRVQSQAWRASSNENLVALPLGKAGRALLLQFCCCHNRVPRCSFSILEKHVYLSSFGRNFDLKPIWSGHVLKEPAIGSCHPPWQTMTRSVYPWLLAA